MYTADCPTAVPTLAKVKPVMTTNTAKRSIRDLLYGSVYGSAENHALSFCVTSRSPFAARRYPFWRVSRFAHPVVLLTPLLRSPLPLSPDRYPPRAPDRSLPP